MRAKWRQPLATPPKGFFGAKRVFVTKTHILALWNHRQLCGYQLYTILPRRRWVAAAGHESVSWKKQQAVAWAEQQISQLG